MFLSKIRCYIIKERLLVTIFVCPSVLWLTFLSHFRYFYIYSHHHHHFVPPFDDEEGLRTVFARGVCGSFSLSFSLFSLLLKRARV